MPTRRRTLQSIVATLSVGLLAGCTDPLSTTTTFEASPAVVATDSAAGRELAIPAGPMPGATVAPAAATRITVDQPVPDLGRTASVTSHGVTHAVIGVPDPESSGQPPRRAYLGELLTLATPSVSPPGVDEQNPAAEVSAAAVTEAFGTDLDPAPVPAPQGGVSTTTIDGAPPTAGLLRTAYDGVLDSVELTRSPNPLGDGVLAPATVASGRPLPATTGTAFGTRFESAGTIVFVLGWLATTAPAPRQSLGDVATLLERPDSAVVLTACPDDGCRNHLARLVTTGLLDLLGSEAGRAQSLAAAAPSLVSTARRRTETLAEERTAGDGTAEQLATVEAALRDLEALLDPIATDVDRVAAAVEGWHSAVSSGSLEPLSAECEQRSTSGAAAERVTAAQRFTTAALEAALALLAPTPDDESEESNRQQFALQRQLQRLNLLFELLAGIVETAHDTACAAIRNMR